MTTERRTSLRQPLILDAEVTEVASGTKLNARTTDVGRTGCYIDMLNPNPADTAVSIRLTQGGESFQAHGNVIYVSPGLGMGISFENVPADQQAILDRWLAAADG